MTYGYVLEYSSHCVAEGPRMLRNSKHDKAGHSACESEGGRGDTYYTQSLGLSPSDVTLNCVQDQ